MSVILKAVTFGPAGRQRQDGIQAVQSLNGRFLVDTKDGRMLRWVDVETNNISRFGFKGRIIGGHVALRTMVSETGPLPDPRPHHVMDTQLLGQLPGAPVGRSVRRCLAGPSQDPSF